MQVIAAVLTVATLAGLIIGGYVGIVKVDASENTCDHSYENGVCTDCGSKEWDTNGDGKLNILAIGNSFSVDALQYAWRIANKLGIAEINIGNLYIGGCTLEKHATNAVGDLAKYTYYEFVNSASRQETKDYKISQALASRDWDYISMQQASGKSGVESTYNEDLTYLIEYVQERSNAKLVWHMTWAYQQDSTHSEFPTYNSDQMTMYNAIASAVQNVIVPNENFDYIVPNGTAVQNARTSFIGDNLTRDGYHMSLTFGRYLTGLMFIKTVTGLAVDQITWKPDGVTEQQQKVAMEAVNNAYATPYAVTQSNFTDAQYELTELLNAEQIKPLGRTQVNAAKTGITADWAGSGFQINVGGNGGDMTVAYTSSYSSYFAVLVDGKQVWRGSLSKATGGSSFTVTIPAGSHTVTVVKEQDISDKETDYFYLTTLTLAGAIADRPADQELLVEFIGDSIVSGCGSLGTYEPGVAWNSSHHSALHSFSWYCAEDLGADASIVARGGIGVFVGESAQEGTQQHKAMQDIYWHTSGYNQSNGEFYDKGGRKPDIIVVRLGANDNITATNTIEVWKDTIGGFVKDLQAKHPGTPIVYTGKEAEMLNAFRQLVEEKGLSGVYTFQDSYVGNGSAALGSQTSGHADAEEQKALGLALSNFIKTMVLPEMEQTPAQETAYEDIYYYVSEDGSDSNDGLTIGTAKATLQGAHDAAKKLYGSASKFPVGSRLVIYVQGTVCNKPTGASSDQRILDGAINSTDGAKVPILVTTYDYSKTQTKAVIDSGRTPTNTGNASLMVRNNDVTFQNIAIQSTARKHTDGKTYRDYKLYGCYNEVVFDNTTFQFAGDAPTGGGDNWIVSPGYFTGEAPSGAEGTVIFKNGDYTNLAYVTNVNIISNTVVSNGVHKIVVEDGAHIGTIYNRHNTAQPASATVEIRGGTVDRYVGTNNSKTYAGDLNFIMSGGTVKSFVGTGDDVTVSGDVNFTMSGGYIYGTGFWTAGTDVTITGDINNTISSGIIQLETGDTETVLNGFFFGGKSAVKVQNVNNHISGGQFRLIITEPEVDACYYFGGSEKAVVNGNVTNIISGGAFLPIKDFTTGSIKNNNIYLGAHGGSIMGTLRNEISGGCFDDSIAGAGQFCFSSRSLGSTVREIVNVLGRENSTVGPYLRAGRAYLGGGWTQAGRTSRHNGDPAELAEIKAANGVIDTVVISNTVYGGYFSQGILAAPGSNVSGTTRAFTQGSVQTDIYGGLIYGFKSGSSFVGSFYGSGAGAVYGNVTTNIHGGTFASIYGVGDSGTVTGDVTLNIYGMKDYYPVTDAPKDLWKIWPGGSSTTIGGDLRLNIAPENSEDLTLYMPISVGAATGGTLQGSVDVSVSGGVYPQGFAVEGLTVNAALAEGYGLRDTQSGLSITLPDDATTSGTGSVTVTAIPVAEDLKFTNASVSLYADLGVNFKANSSLFGDNGFTDPYVVFQFGETETVVSEYTVSGDKALFRFRNIAPHRIGQTITATLYATKDGVLYTSSPITYSVEDYCYNTLARYSDDSYAELRTLLVDLLNYGALSQQYVDNDIAPSELVNAALTAEQKAWGTATNKDLQLKSVSNKAYETIESPTVTWEKGGLYLEESVAIRLKLGAEDLEGLSVKFVMDGKTYEVTEFKTVADEANMYYVYFTGLNASHMRQTVYATAYKNGTPVSDTLSYSVESYVYNNQDSDNPQLADLVKAVIRYGDSAYAYAN